MGGDDNGDILSDEHAVEQAKEYLRQGDTVEFYERIASKLLKDQPSDPVGYCLNLVKQEKNDTVDTQVKQDQSSRPDDSKYMKKHNVSDFLDKWILALISAKSGGHMTDEADADRERRKFHIAYLEKLQAKSKDTYSSH